jgi:hypothetical protein
MKDEALKLAKAWFERNTYGDEAVEVYEAIEQALAAPVRPLAYLYHDATSPELANPMLHSTLLVFAGDRRRELRGETPLCQCAPPARPAPVQEPHPDDLAVNRFAAAMKTKDARMISAYRAMLAAAPEKGEP